MRTLLERSKTGLERSKTGDEATELVLDEPRIFILGRRVLILFAAMSYIVFFIEVYLGHYIWLQLFLQRGIFNPAIIPIFFSPFGLIVATITAFRITPGTVLALRVVMVASIVLGLVGTYFHLMPRFEAGAGLLSVELWLGDPPALAPPAFAFPGIIGLVASYALNWRRVSPAEKAREQQSTWSWLPQRPRQLHEGPVESRMTLEGRRR